MNTQQLKDIIIQQISEIKDKKVTPPSLASREWMFFSLPSASFVLNINQEDAPEKLTRQRRAVAIVVAAAPSHFISGQAIFSKKGYG